MRRSRPAPLTDEMLEDCLQALHRLEGQGRPADTEDVAAFARITAALTTQALRELEARGLVQDGVAGGARLTGEGRMPETCPHGGPIPAADGSLTAPATRPLDQVAAGTRVWIQQIIEEEAPFLRYLASLGLLPQAQLRVEEVAPFGGPLLVQVGDARYALGRDVAAKILVRIAPAEGA
jgi:Fe2+ transport system protein FeoA